jgi:hypothetical protein
MSLALTTTHENGIFRGVSGGFMRQRVMTKNPPDTQLWLISHAYIWGSQKHQCAMWIPILRAEVSTCGCSGYIYL